MNRNDELFPGSETVKEMIELRRKAQRLQTDMRRLLNDLEMARLAIDQTRAETRRLRKKAESASADPSDATRG